MLPRPSTSSVALARVRPKSGFALLITVTLLAFLVLLLVSLASLTRVETQVAGNNQSLSQARQNALMALNLALGQVQTMLGPDTRVTAPASQKGDGLAAYAATDFDNNANWVGVYRQDPATGSRNPQLLNWLVSGNEGLSVPAAGANTPGVTPNAAVTGLARDMTVSTPVKVGTRDAVLLVGPGSTMADPAASAPVTAVDRFVVAPIQPISVAASLVPGLGTTAPAPTIGRYAYWVGDESTKAKVSLDDPWKNPSAATLAAGAPALTPAQAQTYSFVNAQKSGIEFINTDGANTSLGAAYPADSAGLSRVVSLSQLPLANTSSSASLGRAMRHRFHDLTATSRSVIADVANGGLKKDLTAWAAETTPAAPASGDLITPGHSADTAKYGLPKWGLLHDYMTTRNTGAATLARPQTPTKMGVYPVITYARIAYNMTCPEGAASGRYRFNIMPCIVLWNPCNVPISKNSSLEFCYKYTQFNYYPASASSDQAMLKLFDNNPGFTYLFPDTFNLTRVGVTDSSNVFHPYGAGNANQFWRFKVALSQDLAAGESRLFTLSDAYDQTVYAAGVSTLSDDVVAPENSVYLPNRTSASGYLNRPNLCIRTSPYPTTTPPYPAVQTEFLLTQPPAVSATTAAQIEASLRADAYQTLLGAGFGWQVAATKSTHLPTMDPTTIAFYHRLELTMSTVAKAEAHGTFPGTPRWLATLNPGASIMLRNPSSVPNTPASYPAVSTSVSPSYLKQDYWDVPYPPSPPYVNRPVPQDDAGNVSAGTKVSPTIPLPVQNLIVREFQPADVPLFSIAQFQHANVSTLNLNPAYAVGNSAANLYVARTATDSGALTAADIYAGMPGSTTFNRIYDLSYLLNQSLWDGYFFSTVPATLTTDEAKKADYRLPNSRHDFYWQEGAATDAATAALKATSTAAAFLTLDGGFNVNSTSVEAWRALLASHNGVATDPADVTKKHPFSRFTSPVAEAQPNHPAPWMSYRILSDAQIDALATAIVSEVRTRGPFLSLSDFVNRRLVADATGLKGPLQAAIDATTGAASINGVAPFTTAALQVTDYMTDIPSTDTEQRAIYLGGTDATQPSASRAAYAPGFLTQADVLTAIGPELTARADTFRIRTYGDVMNPVNGSTTPEARAWCEAIVQRLPDYTDPQQGADTAPAALNTLNASFGRRFRIVSFRWLSADEI